MDPKTRDRIPKGEMWCLAFDKEFAPWASLVFEMHEPHMWQPGTVDYLNELGVPVMMHDRYPGIERARRFPMERATRVMGRYFECSIVYMLALAFLRKAKDVALHGVSGTEAHNWQRPNIEYLIGMIRGQGRSVWIHPKSTLLQPSQDGVYGVGNFNGDWQMKELARA